ncbi:L,D-transpeptidase [Pilimelia columellifera]|uniref:L,D-transpeptidase n=1 Tax=Pilimelia columellifera TaxID=706574 RepID=UPI0031CF9E70
MAAGLIGILALSAACSGDEGPARWTNGGAGAGEDAAGPRLGAAVTSPAANATGVAPSPVLTFTTQEAASTELAVVDADGRPVAGTLEADEGRWKPRDPLRWGVTYTATVTVTGADGKTATTASSFTTMERPDKLVNVSSFLGDGQTVGVGMPVMVNFGREVPPKLRDDVQRRMAVVSTPRQVGAWHWVDGDTVHYRPKTFWRAGSKVSVRIAARGIPMGDGWFGGADLSVNFNIGPSLIMTVDNKAKSMVVRRDGAVVRTIPVSLGKPKTPSSSGTMLVMERLRKTVFDTVEELGPEEGYRTKIEYAQRLTWGGEFIHSAPWSVASQGRANVSHGCVNMSPENAEWLFKQTKLGDVVTVKGTEVSLRQGNGWTDWNLSWDQYVKGSALPVSG